MAKTVVDWYEQEARNFNKIQLYWDFFQQNGFTLSKVNARRVALLFLRAEEQLRCGRYLESMRLQMEISRFLSEEMFAFFAWKYHDFSLRIETLRESHILPVAHYKRMRRQLREMNELVRAVRDSNKSVDISEPDILLCSINRLFSLCKKQAIPKRYNWRIAA